MTVFVCEDTFDAMMTCIYEAWSSRLGHSNVKLKAQPIGNYELFCEYRHIETDDTKTQSVIRSIQKKISFQAYLMIYRAAMSDAQDKLDAIYRFVIAGFHYGSHVTDFLQEPVVMRIFELSRKVSNEAHFFREFVRFANMNHNVLVSHIEPKSNVLTMIAPHFCDRLPSENWMIIDDTRNLAIVHPSDQDYYLTSLSPTELRELSKETQDPFIDLWKGFFEHIGIKERKNPRCQRNMMPIWYRKHMTEFQK
ncbi:MAG: TIGR03915 family putative DNA repair protein [Anaerostipes sp.]|jgi:probable DNA metabolism protein|nr:TIGR03915 family putative DNA repair protein [Anaerostipes sp.]